MPWVHRRVVKPIYLATVLFFLFQFLSIWGWVFSLHYSNLNCVLKLLFNTIRKSCANLTIVYLIVLFHFQLIGEMAIRRFWVFRLCSISAAIILISLISMLPVLLIMKTDRRFKNQVTEVRLIVTLKDITEILHVPFRKFQKKLKVVCSQDILSQLRNLDKATLKETTTIFIRKQNSSQSKTVNYSVIEVARNTCSLWPDNEILQEYNLTEYWHF